MDRGRFLSITFGLFLIILISLCIAFFLVPDSVPLSVFGHVTVLGECDLVGDNIPCGSVTLSEVVSLINHWAGGMLLSAML